MASEQLLWTFLRQLWRCSPFEQGIFFLPCEFVLLAFVSNFFVNARASAWAPKKCKAAPLLRRLINARPRLLLGALQMQRRASTWAL